MRVRKVDELGRQGGGGWGNGGGEVARRPGGKREGSRGAGAVRAAQQRLADVVLGTARRSWVCSYRRDVLYVCGWRADWAGACGSCQAATYKLHLGCGHTSGVT